MAKQFIKIIKDPKIKYYLFSKEYPSFTLFIYLFIVSSLDFDFFSLIFL